MQTDQQAIEQERIDHVISMDSYRQYLTFMMCGESYAVDILSVMEIRHWEEPTPLPTTPKHVEGVINIRGVIVPVLNLRSMFGLPVYDQHQSSVIVVLQVQNNQRNRMMGVVVDSVSDVFTTSDDNIQELSQGNSFMCDRFIKGVIPSRGMNNDGGDRMEMLILLDVAEVMVITENN